MTVFLMQSLSALTTTMTWICPKLEALSLDGCATLDWDALRNFVESCLPAHIRAYPRQAIPPMLTLPPPTSYSALTSNSNSTSTTTTTAAAMTTLRQPHPTHALAHPTLHGRLHLGPGLIQNLLRICNTLQTRAVHLSANALLFPSGRVSGLFSVF